MRNIWSFIAGGIFGAGLLISGMTDTRKVIGWLDIFGNWDPTLAFVMGGAVVVMALAWAIAERHPNPRLGGIIPPRPDPVIGRNLIIGSTLFGMGWGLAGLCPGPALASVSWGGAGGLVFLGAMVVGMLVAPPIRLRLSETTPA